LAQVNVRYDYCELIRQVYGHYVGLGVTGSRLGRLYTYDSNYHREEEQGG